METHDSLTLLLNKAGIAYEAKELLRDRGSAYIIYTDISEFRLINSIFGYKTGDYILQSVGSYVDETAKKMNGISGRLTADHFCIVAEKNSFDEKYLLQLARKATKIPEAKNYNIHMRFGVYLERDLNEPFEHAIDKASTVMDSLARYDDKQIAYYTDSVMSERIRWKKTIDEFPVALENKEFVMYLQPQMAKDRERPVSAEALVRWVRNGEIVPPNRFIPILEKTRLIARLDKYVWELAAAKLSEWEKRGINDLRISVNISQADFEKMDVCGELKKLTEKYGVDPGRLSVEITETALMTNVPGMRVQFRNLKRSGFSLEIDDFGSGYSSLSELKEFPAEVLKIDKAFLNKTEDTDRGHRILKSVVRLAKDLDMKTIAEGVETKEQLDLMENLGCDLIQGFWFSEPLPVEEFEKKYGLDIQKKGNLKEK